MALAAALVYALRVARISYKPKLPPPLRRITRVACSVCSRSWSVYEGTLPRMWAVQDGAVVCDLPSCRQAAGVPSPVSRRAALNR